jgi:hypothetical protein
MGNAVEIGTVDLATLEVSSSSSSPRFAVPLHGELRLNGVMVPLWADSVDGVVKTINRFTPQTDVTASISNGSSEFSTVPSSESSVATSSEWATAPSSEFSTTTSSNFSTARSPVSTTAPSSLSGRKYLVLTSPENMRVAGDIGIAAALGLATGGVTLASTT